ncbi:MAG: undecaprenyl-diphosphatase UppP [Planctomycetes bacterium]|nr:undecaprenyl-diphosphatase UppP [Planctomycetota bacterium]
MTLLQALVLGIVQGVTEFLPVSSTAHLILVQEALGWEFGADDAFVFNVLVQLGTLLAVVVYFARDLAGILAAALAGLRDRRPLATAESRLGWWVALGTVPAVAAGLAFKGFFKDLQGDPEVVAWVLLGSTAILYVAEARARRTREVATLRAGEALWIGCWQALALFPGVSRSGASISGGLLAGLDRPAAARFSFLLSIPVMLGAGALAVKDLLGTAGALERVPALAAGFLAAAVVGFLAIHWLLRFLGSHRLTAFGPYRVVAAAAMLALLYSRA